MNLPQPFFTIPDNPTVLYLDLDQALWNTREPFSEPCCQFYQMLFESFSEATVGDRSLAEVEKGLFFATNGKLYANITRALELLNKGCILTRLQFLNPSVAAIFEQIDLTPYKPKTKASLKMYLRALNRRYRSLWRAIDAWIAPRRTHRLYQEALADWEKQIHDRELEKLSYEEYSRNLCQMLVRFWLDWTVPISFSGHLSLKRIQKLFSKNVDVQEPLKILTDPKSFTNWRDDMHLSLYYLARLLGREEIADEQEFTRRFSEGSLSPSFHAAWQEFIEKYGCHSEKDWELTATRYREEPHPLLPKIYKLHRDYLAEVWPNPQSSRDMTKLERERAALFILDYTIETFWPTSVLLRQLCLVSSHLQHKNFGHHLAQVLAQVELHRLHP
jgi:hypothetical protein